MLTLCVITVGGGASDGSSSQEETGSSSASQPKLNQSQSQKSGKSAGDLLQDLDVWSSSSHSATSGTDLRSRAGSGEEDGALAVQSGGVGLSHPPPSAAALLLRGGSRPPPVNASKLVAGGAVQLTSDESAQRLEDSLLPGERIGETLI